MFTRAPISAVLVMATIGGSLAQTVDKCVVRNGLNVCEQYARGVRVISVYGQRGDAINIEISSTSFGSDESGSLDALATVEGVIIKLVPTSTVAQRRTLIDQLMDRAAKGNRGTIGFGRYGWSAEITGAMTTVRATARQ
jgi:hypothetical protein